MKRKTLLAALACAFLVFSMLGCGATNKLQTIQLNVALNDGVVPSGQSGVATLQGNGGTIQLQAIGISSNEKQSDLTDKVTYTVVVDPAHNLDVFGNTLIPPCQSPSCPAPAQPPYTNGTVEFSSTGLITAVEPATCTFPDGSAGYIGDYVVTASFAGITSQPIFIPVASSLDDKGLPCGPTTP